MAALRNQAKTAAPLRRGKRPRPLNLALQGGGAHGAFTWGALDALLDQSPFAIDGISGTSAGAVNAVAVAAGLMEGGPEGARATLERLWNTIAAAGAPAALSGTFMRHGLDVLGSGWSPYDLNPLNINPLKEILLGLIDFEKLRQESPVELFIAATEVTTGRAKIFRNRNLSVDAVLASACLPSLFLAVRIGRHLYWDGGFSANPDLVTLIGETSADDTLLVQISPDRNPDRPVSAEKISGNISRLTFNQPLRSQIERIELCRSVAPVPGVANREIRRLGQHRFHLIDGARHTLKLRADTKTRPDRAMIGHLRDQGRTEMLDWLQDQSAKVGRKESVDLHAKYFTDPLPFD